MSRLLKVVPLRALVALDGRIDFARNRLQRTTEADPAFEHRVKLLCELVKKRDEALTTMPRFNPPAA